MHHFVQLNNGQLGRTCVNILLRHVPLFDNDYYQEFVDYTEIDLICGEPDQSHMTDKVEINNLIFCMCCMLFIINSKQITRARVCVCACVCFSCV